MKKIRFYGQESGVPSAVNAAAKTFPQIPAQVARINFFGASVQKG